MNGPRAAGLDGCRAGWVLASAPLASGDVAHLEDATVVVIPDLDPLVAMIDEGAVLVAGIDIPIGLPARDPRCCDREARFLLGPRRSSVFPAPVRSVLAAHAYADACAISRQASGKAISKQLYNIVPKIREVDAAMSARPGLQEQLFEMCPELSFAVMAGVPMTHPKRTAAGRRERLDALRAAFDGEGNQSHQLAALDALAASPPPGAACDDVLDALAGLWTAQRHAAGISLRVGGADTGKSARSASTDGTDGAAQMDETGLRMEMIA